MAKACGRIRKVVTLDEWFWKSYISWSDDCSLCGQSLSCVLWFGVFVLFCFLHFYVILHNKKNVKKYLLCKQMFTEPSSLLSTLAPPFN